MLLELCLRELNMSPERVVNAILEGTLPEVLRNVPRSLEKAWKGKRGENDKGYSLDTDVKAREKARAAEIERREEDDAYICSMGGGCSAYQNSERTGSPRRGCPGGPACPRPACRT